MVVKRFGASAPGGATRELFGARFFFAIGRIPILFKVLKSTAKSITSSRCPSSLVEWT